MDATNIVVVTCTRDEAQKLLEIIDNVRIKSLDGQDSPDIQFLNKFADVLAEALSIERGDP